MKTKEQIQESLNVLESQISKHSKKDLVKYYAYSLYNEAEDDTEIRRLGMKVLPYERIEYDGYAVIPIVNVVENLVKEIESLRNQIKMLEIELYKNELEIETHEKNTCS